MAAGSSRAWRPIGQTVTWARRRRPARRRPRRGHYVGSAGRARLDSWPAYQIALIKWPPPARPLAPAPLAGLFGPLGPARFLTRARRPLKVDRGGLAWRPGGARPFASCAAGWEGAATRKQAARGCSPCWRGPRRVWQACRRRRRRRLGPARRWRGQLDEPVDVRCGANQCGPSSRRHHDLARLSPIKPLVLPRLTRGLVRGAALQELTRRRPRAGPPS